MRVLHVTPTYYPNVGGIEAVIRNMCVGLAHRGHFVGVAHIGPGLAREDVTMEGIPLHRIPLLGNRLVGLAPGLRKIAGDYELIHVHDPQLLAITASVLLYARGIPRVLSTHGFAGHTSNYALIKKLHSRFILRRALAGYKAVLASSKTDHEHARANADHARLFENGVDVASFSPVASIVGRDPRRWLYWGRIAANKRPDLLVDLVCELARRGEDVRLTIAGRPFDDMAASLEKRCEALGMNDRIRILPPLETDELLRQIGKAGLFVSASEYEGFGLTFIEAMAGGLCIVSRDAPPMSQFVRDSAAGVAVDFENIPHAADQVQELMNRHSHAMRERAINYAERFDWNGKIGELEGVYSEVAGSSL